MDQEKLAKDFTEALTKLLDESSFEENEALVLGGSTSEVIGDSIGSNTNMEVAKVLVSIFTDLVKERKLFPVIQCCEHINRALVVERDYARLYDLNIVNVLPIREAGGGFAAYAMTYFKDPVVVEKGKHIRSGIDIGDSFIGMHLDPNKVGVVVRPSKDKIGQAHISMIRTRDKLIGGDRSKHY